MCLGQKDGKYNEYLPKGNAIACAYEAVPLPLFIQPKTQVVRMMLPTQPVLKLYPLSILKLSKETPAQTYTKVYIIDTLCLVKAS